MPAPKGWLLCQAATTALSGSVWRTRSTGMVHRSINCPHIRGEIVDPVAVDDVAETGVVSDYGHLACTTCFPSAPTRRTALVPSDKRKTRTPQWDAEDEQFHPRANDGKFTDGNGGDAAPSATSQPQQPAQPQEQAAAPQQPGQPAQQPPAPQQPAQPAQQPPAQQQAPEGEQALDLSQFVPSPTTTGVGSQEDPVRTESIEDAAAALALGLYVELSQPEQVSTLLGELAAQIKQAKDSGQDLKINLCNVTVKGTNLFCTESKGIPRVKMPQLKAMGIPEGTKAFAEGIRDGDEIDIQPMFLQRLKDMGYAAQETKMLASHLKATQNELGAAKVASITDFVMSEEGAADKIGSSPIFVSDDAYIVDGHHRWASLVAADYADGAADDLEMEVWKINVDIITLLKLANDFAEEYGIPQQKMGSLRAPDCIGCDGGPSFEEINARARRKMALPNGLNDISSQTITWRASKTARPGGYEALIWDLPMLDSNSHTNLNLYVSPYPTPPGRGEQELGIWMRMGAKAQWQLEAHLFQPNDGPAALYLAVPGGQAHEVFEGTLGQAQDRCERMGWDLCRRHFRTAVSVQPPIKGRLLDPEVIKTLPPEHRDAFRKMLEMQQRQQQWGKGGKWYHASKANLPAGTILVPGGGPATDAQFYEDQSAQDRQLGYGQRDQHVWVTPDREDASFWAAMLDAPFIYEVRPENPRPWGVTGADGHVCDAAKIVKQVSKTGRLLTAADIYDKRRLKGDVFGFEHNGRWLLGEATKAVGGTVKAILPFGTTEAIPADGLVLWPIPRHVIVDGEGLRRAYPHSGFASKEDVAHYAWGFTMANGPLMEHMEETGQWTAPRPPSYRSDKEWEKAKAKPYPKTAGELAPMYPPEMDHEDYEPPADPILYRWPGLPDYPSGPLYHGSKVKLPVGTVLHPSTDPYSGTNYQYVAVVWMTTSQDEAAYWAGGDGWVYEVDPIGTCVADEAYNGKRWVAKGAKVKKATPASEIPKGHWRTGGMTRLAYQWPDGRRLDTAELGRIAIEEGFLTAEQVGAMGASNKHAYTDLEKVLRSHLYSMWAKGLIDIGPFHEYLGPDDTWAAAEQRAKDSDLVAAAMHRVAINTTTAKVGDQGYLDRAGFEVLQARVKAKVSQVPQPSQFDIERNLRAMRDDGRNGGDFRGNSYDRRRRTQRLLEEFGNGVTAGCAYCGKLLDATTLEEDKIISGALGGRYINANLIPACRACNLNRSDKPFQMAAAQKVGRDDLHGIHPRTTALTNSSNSPDNPLLQGGDQWPVLSEMH